MQRFPLAVVILNALAFWSAHATAQQTPAAPAGTQPPSVKPSTAPTAPKPATKLSEGPPVRRPDERLSDEAELARVAGLYEAGKYRDCGAELERLLDPLGKTPLRQSAIVENARVYWAACLLGAGQSDAADAPLRAAIHENPQMRPPDSLVFPQPVVQRFLKVRDSLVNEIRAAEQARIKQAQMQARDREQKLARDRDRMLALEKLAQQEWVVVRNRRIFASVPFGVGQIQNRQEMLGYTLMASEVLLGSLSLVAIAAQASLAVKVEEVRNQGDAVDEDAHGRNLATWRTVKLASGWAFAALAVGGVVHAHVEFVPEFRELRQRKLPPSLGPTVLPTPREVSAVPYVDTRGGGLTLTGRF